MVILGIGFSKDFSTPITNKYLQQFYKISMQNGDDDVDLDEW